MPFAEDLVRFGPESRAVATLEQARAYCAQLAHSHYENFSVVTALTPRHLKPAFEAVYAFCRWADDLGDEVGDRDRSLRLLAWWREQLGAMYAGDATHPVYVALAPVVAEFGIPIEPFDRLIQAFEQDQVVVDYDTRAQLLDYCTRSANPVGRIVLYLCRCHDDTNATLSDFTCSGLQLANFWQDVARDLAIGRIYLPRENRDRFRVTQDDLRKVPASHAFRELLADEVAFAQGLLDQGQPLPRRVPAEVAAAIDLFNRGGMAILERIRKQKYDVLRARPKLSKFDKLRLVLPVLAANFFPKSKSHQPNEPILEKP